MTNLVRILRRLKKTIDITRENFHSYIQSPTTQKFLLDILYFLIALVLSLLFSALGLPIVAYSDDGDSDGDGGEGRGGGSDPSQHGAGQASSSSARTPIDLNTRPNPTDQLLEILAALDKLADGELDVDVEQFKNLPRQEQEELLEEKKKLLKQKTTLREELEECCRQERERVEECEKADRAQEEAFNKLRKEVREAENINRYFEGENSRIKGQITLNELVLERREKRRRGR